MFFLTIICIAIYLTPIGENLYDRGSRENDM